MKLVAKQLSYYPRMIQTCNEDFANRINLTVAKAAELAYAKGFSSSVTLDPWGATALVHAVAQKVTKLNILGDRQVTWLAEAVCAIVNEDYEASVENASIVLELQGGEPKEVVKW